MFSHVRRIWSKKGLQPIAPSNRKYEWLYLYAFVHPSSGDVFWLTLPTVSNEAFEIALAHFARQNKINKNNRVILVIDGAGFHRGKNLKIPDGIHLKFLPAYSPELQPAEQLWPLTHEAHANKLFKDLDELEQTLLKRCLWLKNNKEKIKERVKFYWWPND